MGKNLTAILLKKSVGFNFDETYRVLTIPEGSSFTVGIKDYIEDKSPVLLEKEDLENKKKSIEKEQKDNELRLYKEANERYREGGKWLSSKMYDGKIISQVEETLKYNIRDSRERANKLKKQIDRRISELDKKLLTVESKYNNVVWCWVISPKRSNYGLGKNIDLDKGEKQYNIIIGRHLHGGGLCWIEPFFVGEKPTGSITNGFYVRTENKNAEVLIGEWYGKDNEGNFVKIDKPVSPCASVQLHLYTRSMYGHNFNVELKSNGKTLKASASEVVGSPNVSESKKEDTVKPEKVKLTDFFPAEVDVYEYKTIEPPSGSIRGKMLGFGEKYARLEYVQKAIITLFIDPLWCKGEKKLLFFLQFILIDKRRKLKLQLRLIVMRYPI